MSAFSKIWEKLRDKAYREAFVTAQLKRGLPTQIRVMLKDRGWTQDDLARRSGLKQGAISRASDPDYGNLTINTILRIASGFDVAYIGRFVPFSDLARWYSRLSESALSVSSFGDDPGFVGRKEAQRFQAFGSTSRIPYSPAAVKTGGGLRPWGNGAGNLGAGQVGSVAATQQVMSSTEAGLPHANSIAELAPAVSWTPLKAENPSATGGSQSLARVIPSHREGHAAKLGRSGPPNRAGRRLHRA